MLVFRKLIRLIGGFFLTKKTKNYWGAFVLRTFDLFIKDNLSSAEYEVFFLLCHHITGNQNKASLRQVDIKSRLETDFGFKRAKSTISKAIKKLIEMQYIAKEKNGVGYMINPNLFYLGGVQDLQEKRNYFNELLEHAGEDPKYFFDNYKKELVSINDFEDENDFYNELDHMLEM